MFGFENGIELERRTAPLPVPMTEADKVAKGAELVEALAASKSHDRAMKEAVKALRDESEHLRAIIDGLARELKTGELVADVEVVDILDVATKEVSTVRTDTGIVVGTREARVKELNLTLPLSGTEN